MRVQSSSASTDLTPSSTRDRTSGVGERSLFGVCCAAAALAAKALATRTSAAPPVRREGGIAASINSKGRAPEGGRNVSLGAQKRAGPGIPGPAVNCSPLTVNGEPRLHARQQLVV